MVFANFVKCVLLFHSIAALPLENDVPNTHLIQQNVRMVSPSYIRSLAPQESLPKSIFNIPISENINTRDGVASIIKPAAPDYSIHPSNIGIQLKELESHKSEPAAIRTQEGQLEVLKSPNSYQNINLSNLKQAELTRNINSETGQNFNGQKQRFSSELLADYERSLNNGKRVQIRPLEGSVNYQHLLSNPKVLHSISDQKKRYTIIHPDGTIEYVDNIDLTKYPNHVLVNGGNLARLESIKKQNEHDLESVNAGSIPVSSKEDINKDTVGKVVLEVLNKPINSINKQVHIEEENKSDSTLSNNVANNLQNLNNTTSFNNSEKNDIESNDVLRAVTASSGIETSTFSKILFNPHDKILSNDSEKEMNISPNLPKLSDENTVTSTEKIYNEPLKIENQETKQLNKSKPYIYESSTLTITTNNDANIINIVNVTSTQSITDISTTEPTKYIHTVPPLESFSELYGTEPPVSDENFLNDSNVSIDVEKNDNSSENITIKPKPIKEDAITSLINIEHKPIKDISSGSSEIKENVLSSNESSITDEPKSTSEAIKNSSEFIDEDYRYDEILNECECNDTYHLNSSTEEFQNITIETEPVDDLSNENDSGEEDDPDKETPLSFIKGSESNFWKAIFEDTEEKNMYFILYAPTRPVVELNTKTTVYLNGTIVKEITEIRNSRDGEHLIKRKSIEYSNGTVIECN